MAFRTWGRLLLTALGVSVLAGAGQLGIAYGFGVVRLDGAFADGSVNRWPAQLAWVGWFAAVAAVAGAVLTERLARRDGFPGGTTEQLSVAGAAALGAIVVAPLCMQPARAAELGGTVDPVWAVGICAILGALVGAGASIAVLLKPPFGWNIVLTAAAVWLLALLSVTPTVASARPLHTVRLGVLEPSWLDAEAAQRLAMLILPTVALLAGAAVGALARRRGHPPLVGGAAGAAGPVLLAFAYLTAGPGDAIDRYQLAPYYGALIAVAAGVLGSAATTVLRRPAVEAGSDALEPTDILQPLPPSPAIPGAPEAGSSALAARPAPDGADETPTATAAPGPDAAADAPGWTRRGPGQREAGGPTPAHWDWPAPAGVTPASVPAGRTPWGDVRPDPELRRADRVAEDDRAGRPDDPVPTSLFGSADPDEVGTSLFGSADPDEVPTGRPGDPGEDDATPADPVRDAGLAGSARTGLPGDPDADVPPVAGRDTEDLVRSLPVPGLLPPGRRTAAIDVLAAGRPVEPAGPNRAEPLPDPPAERRDRKQRGTAAPHRGQAEPAASAPAPGPSPSAESTSGRARRLPPAAEPIPAAPASPGAPRAANPVPVQPASPGAPPAAEPPAPAVGQAPAPAVKATTETATAPRPRRRQPVPPASGATGGADPEPGSATGPERAVPARSGAAATEPPAADPPVPAEPRPAGRSKRPRKGRTSPAATGSSAATTPVDPGPPEADPTGPAETGPTGPAETGTARPAEAGPAEAGPTEAGPADAADGLPAVPVAEAPDATTDGPTRGRNFFFDPAPVDAPASPRPRFPIFEDVTDGPGSVRPAWPIAPAPVRPVSRRVNGGDPDDATGGDATPGGPAPVEPAPRPRHRALPDLGRGTAWDALATARHATTGGEDPPSEEDGRHAAHAAATTPAGDDPYPGEPATAAGPGAGEPGNGKAKQRRGLFRRNRAKGAEPPEVEELARDEEYVDWVAGLASDDNPEDARTLRTGRHHRD